MKVSPSDLMGPEPRSRTDKRATDSHLEADDARGAATWHRILDTIEKLQATKPKEQESQH